MPRQDGLRASDADREHIVERLRNAAAEGRIAAHELEQRVGVALGARTYRELDATVADLPSARARPARIAAVSSLRSHPVLLLAAVPIVLVAVVLVAAITIASLAIGAALFLLGRRRALHLGAGGCASRRLIGRPAGARRGAPGRWEYWA